LSKIQANKILARSQRREYLTAIGIWQSGCIAICAIVLLPDAINIQFVVDAALEIDHARTFGGSPPAPLRAFAFGTNRPGIA
jgi:hypothetical protein